MAVLASAYAQNTISLNGEWQFCLAKTAAQADALVSQGFFQPSFNTSDFISTPVPSNWAVLGYEEPVYRGFKNNEASEGLYLKRFAVPASFNKKRVLLHFGGVWNSAEVWMNGRWIGRHDSGYTSFSFDVSNSVKTGQENVLAVRVSQVYPGCKTDTYDDWTLGGIYRDVTLESMPAKRRIDNIRVQTKMSGEVEVQVMVADTHRGTLPGNYRSPGESYQLQLTLTDCNGEIVVNRKIDVASHTSTSRETLERLLVDNPKLWSAETPYLYTLKVDLLENGKETHSRTQKIGIREISTKGGVFRINGQAVKLRGVNRHDEHPDVGRATTPKHWLEDLQLMKAANINYIRACHYQHAKGFIEMCDSMGMYVGAEVSLGGAIATVNEIRERAGCDPVSATSADEALKLVKMERRLELAGEGVRWFDEVRYNSWKQDIIEMFNRYGNRAGTDVANVVDGRYIYAIPANQMAITPGLYQQNAGY
jgi:beta-galactosidase